MPVRGFVPRAASGLLDDPNRSAWLLADSLGLNRVVLYSCVATFGLTRLRGTEGHAPLRLQLVHSGVDEMFGPLLGECPFNALLGAPRPTTGWNYPGCRSREPCSTQVLEREKQMG